MINQEMYIFSFYGGADYKNTDYVAQYSEYYDYEYDDYVQSTTTSTTTTTTTTLR